MKRVLNKFSVIFLLAITIAAFGKSVNEPSPQGGENSMMSHTSHFEATDYYLYGEKKVLLQKMDGKFYIEFYSDEENKIREKCTRRSIKIYDVHPIRDRASFTAVGTERSGAKKFTNLKVGFMEGSYEQCAEVLSSALYWSPFYKLEDEQYEELKVSSKFTVILKPSTTLKQIEELALENAIEMIGIDEHDSNWYHLACTHLSKGNALEMANLFYESSLFETAWPNCISGKLSCINEPNFTNGTLWHLGNNTTNANIHVNYCSARGIIPQASSNVTVAVIDAGVQTNHPDLPNVLPGWDAHSHTWRKFSDSVTCACAKQNNQK